MKRLSAQQMLEYWREHDNVWSDLDYDKDPGGLTNVIHSGAPTWLNEYYAHFQRWTYLRLLAMLPPAPEGARAIDVGCGAGRWCEVLTTAGYATTGIDLQTDVIEANRRRFPAVRFVNGSILEFRDEDRFDLVSTVTVLQHMPFAEQDEVIRHLRQLIRQGGHVLVLENVREQAQHVFANSTLEWSDRFRQGGFSRLALQRYDYSFTNRLYRAVTGKTIAALRRLRGQRIQEVTPVSLSRIGRSTSANRSLAKRISYAQLRLLVEIDRQLEPLLVKSNVDLPTVHCGFLFQAV